MKYNIKTSQLILILGIIILAIPPLLTLPAFSNYFNFSLSGQIGDTIGGITSPFINALGAILVFLAFKEQIKANNLIKEQQYFQHIQEQIHRLEDNFIDLSEVSEDINSGISESRQWVNNFNDHGVQEYYSISKSALNKAIYTITVFELTSDLINKMESNKEFLLKKLKMIYLIIYQEKYLIIDNALKNVMGMESSTKLQEADLLFMIKNIENKFAKD